MNDKFIYPIIFVNSKEGYFSTNLISAANISIDVYSKFSRIVETLNPLQGPSLGHNHAIDEILSSKQKEVT
jgi:hypothetical protein